MGLLRVAVLGSPEVFHDGSRLTFALRKAQALLLYLAVEGGMHPRSKLAALLWPDSEPSDARKGLRNALALLRGLLADADASPAVHSHLLSEHELLGLNLQASLELDLDVVQQAWKEAQALSTAPAEQQRSSASGRCACSSYWIGSPPGRRKPLSWSRPRPRSRAGWRSIHSRRRPTGA